MHFLKRLNFKIIISTLVLVLMVLSVYVYYNHAEEKQPVVIGTLSKQQILSLLAQRLMISKHYTPKQINDKSSKEIFALYLKRLDYDKHFFLKSDIKALSSYKVKIDDELQKNEFDFYKAALKIRTQRIEQARAVLDIIFASKIDFSKKKFFESDRTKRNYAANQNAFNEFWKQKIKILMLENIYVQRTKKAKAQKKKNIAFLLDKITAAEIKASKLKVGNNLRNYFKRINNQKEKEQHDFNVFLDAVVSIFDPHSSYFPPQKKQDFDIDMSGTLEGIGAVLTEEDGNIKVMRIIPGSASYRQKELQAGDLIIKVGQGNGELENVQGMSVHDVVKLIRGQKGTLVTLTIKRDDGTIRNIPIVRNTVVLQGTYAKSTVISNANTKGKQYGYIDLPKFYHNFGSASGRQSAEDVRSSILTLKQANINGLILDLRSNGGGALQDAVQMAGFFIKSGPIVQVMDSLKKVEVHYDEDPNVLYTDSLIVMINEHSASASEIVAAALKDYGRAIIVGQNTFGKGTVQQIFSLDNSITFLYRKYRPFGSMIVTIQKFYRINGKSTQFKGVNPHISFNLPTNNKDKEQFLEYALSWNEIAPSTYKTWIQQAPNQKKISSLVKSLKSKSEQRMKNNPYYNAMTKANNNKDKNTKISLQADEYFAKQKKNLQLFNEVAAISKQQAEVAVALNEQDQLNAEAYMKEWYKDIQKDHLLGEAINILTDIKEM